MTFKTKRRINFFDCDPAGIMFYGNAFFLAHSAYEELLASAGLTGYWINDNYIVPIIKADTDYLKPLRPGDEVEIEVRVSNLKERSFELTCTCRLEDGTNTFNTRTVHIFTDRDFKKINIPDDILVILSEYQ
jgi:YbgC/YbaW family acyl-CoA thioester hydrolase